MNSLQCRIYSENLELSSGNYPLGRLMIINLLLPQLDSGHFCECISAYGSLANNLFWLFIIQHMWPLIQVTYFHSCSLTVVSYSGRGNYGTINTLSSCLLTISCQKRKILLEEKNKPKKKIRKKELFPECSWGKKKQRQRLYLNTFSWKFNAKRHWQGHSECEIIQF